MSLLKYKYNFGWYGGRTYSGPIKASNIDEALQLLSRKFDVDIEHDTDWWEILFGNAVLRSSKNKKETKQSEKPSVPLALPAPSKEESKPEVLKFEKVNVEVKIKPLPVES